MKDIFGKITDYDVLYMNSSLVGLIGIPLTSKGVIVTHLPTGICFSCDTETSQHANCEKCFAAIKSALNSRNKSHSHNVS